MSDMVERVARAIFGSPAFYGADPNKPKWVDGGNSHRQCEARDLARVAILATLQPTPGMISAGIDHTGGELTGVQAVDLFQAMIDEALK